MTENIQVAVIGPELEELMFGAVPLIDDFLHEILALVQLKAKRSLVGLTTGVTLNVQPHDPLRLQRAIQFAIQMLRNLALFTGIHSPSNALGERQLLDEQSK
jgi:hypothetical protein